MHPRRSSQLLAPQPLALLIGSALILLAGCVRHEMKKSFPTDPEFTTETISSLVLRNGTEVEFGPDGGHYAPDFSIAGVTREGERVTFQSGELQEVRLSSPPFVPALPAGEIKVAELIARSGFFLQFDSTRASLDSSSGRITGRLVSGEPCVVILRDIQALRMTPVPAITLTDLRQPGFVLNILRQPELKVAEVVVGSGPSARQRRLVQFNASGGTFENFREAIDGIPKSGPLGPYPLDSILYGSIERVDAGQTVFATLGGLAIGAAIVAIAVAATKESCPFVYSHDGSRYVFDAEPLGGATSKVLARTDYSLLEHLQPSGGMYRLLVRNEVAETQYIDAMALLAVDHRVGETPVIDALGQVQLVRATSPPVTATDENGVSILPQVGAIDGVAWQTHLESVSQTEPASLRHTLTFTFVRPPHARRARIVARVGTTLWGSAMIRCLYDLRGDAVEQWHAKVDRKEPELFQMLDFMEREELFSLRVLVLRGETWIHRGHLAGGGPFIHETQILPLTQGSVTGDSLVLRVRPPLGFWSVDFVGVEYDPGPGEAATPLRLTRANDQDGRDITELLAAEDQTYSVMPTTAHWTALEFVAPPLAATLERTVFLQTSGYYRLHLDKDKPEDLATLQHLSDAPGNVVRFSLDKYREWYAGVRSLPISERRKGGH